MKTKRVTTVLKEVEGQRIRVSFWQPGGLLLIRVDDDLFTVAQMFQNSYLRFFDLQSKTENFGKVDLNECRILFTVAALANRRKGEKALLIREEEIIPFSVPLERYWIKPNVSFSGKIPWKGGNLVDMEGRHGSGGFDAPIVKGNLDAKTDRNIILTHELTNMQLYDDMLLRLRRYFEAGVNIDELKYEIFPDLEPVRPVTDTRC